MRHPNIATRIVADSMNPRFSRLTSFICTYPRFIHSELMTHRAFSRNAASSRAIPIRKMLEAVETNPATFEYWGSKNAGMQAGGQLCLADIERARDIIRDMQECAVNGVAQLETLGLAKQNSNRYLEPFGHITVLITASQAGFDNFFALRAHPAAQPEFQTLAYRMLDLYMRSHPREVEWGGWHMPRFGNMDVGGIGGGWSIMDELKVVTARCARLSYLTFDGEHSIEKDIATHDSLVANGHWSPFEHPAQAIDVEGGEMGEFSAYPWSNYDINFQPSGWGQYRKLFANECRECDYASTLASKPEWVTLD